MTQDPSWPDWLVLTAADRGRAAAFESQLQERSADGRLPASCRWLVVPDPGGRRVGSGAATLVALETLVRRLARQGGVATVARLLKNQRVLLVHCGGDSRRLPAYAAAGKSFAPVPEVDEAGRPLALFDLLVRDLITLPTPATGHVLIATGDVMLGIGQTPIDFASPGVTVVGASGSVERGSRHGVFVGGTDDVLIDVLQKPSADEAAARNAIREDGTVLIDTGLVGLDPQCVQRLLDASGLAREDGRFVRRPGLLAACRRANFDGLDLYEHLLAELPRPNRDRTTLGKSLTKGGAHLQVAPPCEFLHLGSSRELLDRLHDEHRNTAPVASIMPEGRRRSLPILINSDWSRTQVRLRGRAYVEACDGPLNVRLDGDNLLVGLHGLDELHLRTGRCLVVLPVGTREWAVVVHDIDDDFKTPVGEGGHWLGQPLTTRMGGDLTPEDTAWDIPLFVVGRLHDVLDAQSWMLDARPRMPSTWPRRRLRSLAEIIEAVDHERWLAHRRKLADAVGRSRVVERLSERPWEPIDDLIDACRGPSDRDVMSDRILAAADREPRPLTQARLTAAAAQVLSVGRGPRGPALMNEALGLVRDALTTRIEWPRTDTVAAIGVDQPIWVSAPVRIDLAGGWTDTPPICMEQGGTVLNVAITLNGADPVQVMARRIDTPVIELHSVDLDKTTTLTSTAEVLDNRDPRDWTNLVKSALLLSGIAPRQRRASLRKRLESFGGGLALTTSSAAPKGSGLGTSSILGAAVLSCLAAVAGEIVSEQTLIERTSVLEQLMRTGGGWQDQIGSIVGGFKITRTTPGLDQRPTVERLAVPTAALSELRSRALLYFTGHRRLAADILQTVIGRYMTRDRASIAAIQPLRDGAEGMREALLAGDIDQFGVHLADYWRLKQTMDPASCTDRITAMVEPLQRDLAAWELPGAGGGGFLFLLARDQKAARRLRRRLESHPPNRQACLYDFEVEPDGMKIVR